MDGFVRAPDGIGVRGVSVRASFNADKDGRDVSVSARTDATGAFRIGGLGDACTLTVDVPPEFVRPDPVEVKGGATGVEIRLRAAVQVQITVLDATGKPVPDAWVIASLGGRVQASSAADARTDSNGVARLGSRARRVGSANRGTSLVLPCGEGRSRRRRERGGGRR